MSTWKQLIAKPAGSMPGGGLTQWAVGLGTLLMAALFMFWPYFGGGGEVETLTAGQGRQPAGPDMQDQVSGQVQEESLRQQQLDDARDRLDRQQRDASNVAGGRITALDLFDPPAPGEGAGASGGPRPRPSWSCARRCGWKRSRGGGARSAPHPLLNPIEPRGPPLFHLPLSQRRIRQLLLLLNRGRASMRQRIK